MGYIIKKVIGDVDSDPNYEIFSIEINQSIVHRKRLGIIDYPGIVHIHSKNIRLDLAWDDYKILRDNIISGYKEFGESKK